MHVDWAAERKKPVGAGCAHGLFVLTRADLGSGSPPALPGFSSLGPRADGRVGRAVALRLETYIRSVVKLDILSIVADGQSQENGQRGCS